MKLAQGLGQRESDVVSNQTSSLRRVLMQVLVTVASLLTIRVGKGFAFMLGERRQFHRLLTLMASQCFPFPEIGKYSHSCTLNYSWKRSS
jgi:hypothetical protein